MASPTGLGGGGVGDLQQSAHRTGNVDGTQAGPSRLAKTRSDERVSLFDASHIPTILPRISRLSELVVEASGDARSLTTTAAAEATQGRTDVTSTETGQVKAPPSPEVTRHGINVALGATDDDDTTTGYETALSLSFGAGTGSNASNAQPSALAQSLVRESLGLRDAFARARMAIDTLDGGDMDIDEQERLIAVLERYSEVQSRFGQSIYEKGAFAADPISQDVEMREAA